MPDTFPTHRRQDDKDAQPQTVADDAIRGLADEEGRKEPSGNAVCVASDDSQDVAYHMTQMERSGPIDCEAYRGERSDDDEISSFGDRAADDDMVRLSDE